MTEENDRIEDETQSEFERIVLERCYSRHYCACMGVDYCEITPADLEKIREDLYDKFPKYKSIPSQRK